ncbi:hypothetical protein EYF80_056217 [Liparis tanakae]|uniref:Uncharacterized protein n=1 Tax=Liparis tanakae TaxID=230148 RepID=A0A4Z2EXC4_9TELE|nr:hypothetical protein EYF80_056217 [Liparis tanakae]
MAKCRVVAVDEKPFGGAMPAGQGPSRGGGAYGYFLNMVAYQVSAAG